MVCFFAALCKAEYGDCWVIPSFQHHGIDSEDVDDDDDDKEGGEWLEMVVAIPGYFSELTLNSLILWFVVKT